ncbi:hypothetical protein [Mycetohabitans rhizoxinica]|uniref:hypothetical protein n=1 Tax=Mycetohabitans rhizoxinica TaxID=412963 RepID=UPI0030CF5BB0
MKLPGISKIPNLLSLKTKNGWKEIQKNSSVAAKKGQNFILDNIRPLGANKDIKARWSISASQKPVNRSALPKKINVDFAKVVNNVWLHKTSGSMPLKGINDKLKGSLSGTKIANSFFQKTSTVSDKDRDALQARANNMFAWLVNAEDAIDGLRHKIIENGNKSNNGNRVELDPRLRKSFDEAISAINLSKDKILKYAQTNPYRRNGSLPKTELSKEHYNKIMKDMDDIKFDIQSRLKITKKIFDDLSKT